jgi:hypothetical protein
MKITADFTRLYTGENGSATLHFVVSEKNRDKTAKLCFLTSMGKTYYTDAIPCESGEGSYILPSALTDGRGVLLCQLFLTDEKGEYLLKSPVYSFHVYKGVGDKNENTIDSVLKGMASGLSEGGNINADYSGLYTASLR